MMDTSSNINWLHSPHSEMHEAISHCDLSRIREQLVMENISAADTFCFDDGDNCFVLAARKSSESTNVANRRAFWLLLEKILLLEPQGINARSADGQSLLMYFCDDVTKVEKLVSLGADVNALDSRGNSALHIAAHNLQEENYLLTFRFLLGSGARLSTKYLKLLVLRVTESKFVDHQRQINAAHCLMEIMQHPAIPADILLSLSQHPFKLFYLINRLSSNVLMGNNAVLNNLRQATGLVVSGHRRKTNCIMIPPEKRTGHKAICTLYYLPKSLIFDKVGLFLFRINLLDDLSEENVDKTVKCLELMLEQEQFNTTKNEVVPPLCALLYNINVTCNNVHGDHYQSWSILISRLLYKCMEKLKEIIPLPHHRMQITSMSKPTLRILALISPLLVSDDEHLLDCVMAMLQLSHEHPYNIVGFWLNNVFKNVSRRKRDLFEKTFVPKLISRILGSCGVLTTNGLAAEEIIQCKPFYDNLVNVCVFWENQRLENIKTSALLSKNDMSSLKWLSIMQIRKQLYLNRKDPMTTLPHTIRSLFADGLLPRCLERNLLVYAPNRSLIF